MSDEISVADFRTDFQEVGRRLFVARREEKEMQGKLSKLVPQIPRVVKQLLSGKVEVPNIDTWLFWPGTHPYNYHNRGGELPEAKPYANIMAVGDAVPTLDPDIPWRRWGSKPGPYNYPEHRMYKFELVPAEAPFTEKQWEFMASYVFQESGIILHRAATEIIPLDRIRNEREIEGTWPESTILDKGEIWHVGWDIADHYYVVEDKSGNLHFLMSTNGHGFGMDYVLSANSVDRFANLEQCFRSLEQSNIDLREKWKDRIMENWLKQIPLDKS